MKRLSFYSIAVPLILSLAALPSLGQGHSQGHGGQQGQGNRPAETGKPAPPPQSTQSSNKAKSNKPSSQQHEAKSVAEMLQQDQKLSAKLKARLPNDTDLNEASAGFKNLGQFVAAVNASHNLNIPFNDLKARVNGGANLGDAIHQLKPDADAKAEVKKAEAQAKKDMKKGS